jgi:hypothetical protein
MLFRGFFGRPKKQRKIIFSSCGVFTTIRVSGEVVEKVSGFKFQVVAIVVIS